MRQVTQSDMDAYGVEGGLIRHVVSDEGKTLTFVADGHGLTMITQDRRESITLKDGEPEAILEILPAIVSPRTLRIIGFPGDWTGWLAGTYHSPKGAV